MLAHKELELARVGQELESLRIVASLLRDEEDRVGESAEAVLTLVCFGACSSLSNGRNIFKKQ